MKYLLIAVIVYASGDTSGLYPTSWFDDEATCQARGESMHDELSGMESGETLEVYFDCIGLSPLDILIMGEAIPYRIPRQPEAPSASN